ncbi:phosphate acyltransferase PlsX [Terricaulis silvestris]|uniref:Phosphate acyltransferase n=1 Tax=Terricaulis silvestris TaxID=2686094 RepID=A0A6I6MJF1_9CAUL|nr:phosphate acyltransferase PlsX [Terricaulis silvestris]QGZ95280.1 Phosphate acyltransferase [Terricaulis silvestris]
MSDGLVLSIDGMGGDHAPDIVVEGVDIAARRSADARFLIHGDPTKLAALLEKYPRAKAQSEIVPAEKAIGMEIKASQALRQGKGSSLWNAVEAVKEGRANAVVSAGNTGAFMAISMFRLRTMEGVHRPALTTRWPNAKGGYTVMLDVGANVEANGEQLVEFAIMGEAFARAVTGVDKPSVALLNVGAEEQKGHEEIRAAAQLIRETGVDLNFQGFVEGDDIAKGTVDVVVTDGFTGNIALKTGEGTARLVGQFLREALTGGVMARLGALIAYPALQQLRKRMDPGTFNGALFLGLNGLVVKSHGSANGRGFAAAIGVAEKMARSHYREEIAHNLERLAHAEIAAAAKVGDAG